MLGGQLGSEPAAANALFSLLKSQKNNYKLNKEKLNESNDYENGNSVTTGTMSLHTPTTQPMAGQATGKWGAQVPEPKW